MIELLALAGLVVAGLAVVAVVGMLVLMAKVVFWAILLPFRILFKVLMIPVWLTLGAIGALAGAALLPLLLAVLAAVAIVGLLAAALAVVLPLIPFILLGLAVWAVARRRPAVA